MKQKSMFETFAVLKPNLGVDAVDVSPTLYAELDKHYNKFNQHVLVSAHTFSQDWQVWEKHPAGDEIVMLLSGCCELVIRQASGEETQSLTSIGDFAIVPQNLWHTARTSTATQLLFITPGENTQNCDLDQA
ncbi:cupin domain-containing protein [Aliiglaciecola litoralis]|uniref:Cupin domain-containing protein n=1 Tax=Aliiglaciecola litoralis TaxID=582857 RepID=A0ABP3WPS2_9ALTE